MAKKREIKSLVDRFGSNRTNAEIPGQMLQGCSCIGVPFAGGMCEIKFMTSNITNVNDLDAHVMNLASVVRDRREELAAELDGTMFDGRVLKASQEFCKQIEQPPLGDFGTPNDSLFDQTLIVPDPFEWAYHYFVASWMTRGGKMGTDGDLDQGMSIRWKSGGGDSVVRFRNATAELAEWQKVMQKCTFTTLDAFDFLAECRKRDVAENGIYADPPWPDDGDKYRHKFPPALQKKLRDVLESFEKTKIVVRYGDHPLIRELYSEDRWTWNLLKGRNQANDEQKEVLLTNWRPS